MRKTLFLLFVGIAMMGNAQTMEVAGGDTSCDTAACTMARRHQGGQRHKAGKRPMTPQGKRNHMPAFMKNLSEADKAMVKEVMDSYRKDCKAVREKYGVGKHTKGEKPTEQQMDAMVKARMSCRAEVLKLQEKYYGKLRKALAPQQAAALLGMGNRGAGRPAYSRGHNGNGNRPGHHAGGRPAKCSCTK